MPLLARADPWKKAVLRGVSVPTRKRQDPDIHAQQKYTQTHANMRADIHRHTETPRHSCTHSDLLTQAYA